MPTLTEIRARYPEYSDLDDATLLDGLYRRYYPDMPREEFERKIGGRQPRPTAADALLDAGESAVRGFNKGVAGIVTAPYRAIDWVGEKVTGGDFLPNAEDMPLYKPFLQQPEPKTTAGRYAGAAGEAVGASTLPTAALVGNAQRLSALAPTTVPRAIGQRVGQSIAANPRAAVAADVASATGAGVGQQAAEDAGFGPGGQAVAAMVGGMTPLALNAAVSQTSRTIQRALANQGEAGAYGKIVENLGGSVDDFAQAVARGDAAPQTVPLNRRVLDILGEEMIRASGNVGRAQHAAIARIMAEQGVTRQTAANQIRTLVNQYRNNPLMFGEFPATIEPDRALRGPQGGLLRPQNVDIEALNRPADSATQSTLDYLANSGNAQSAIGVRNAIGQRQPTLDQNMRQTLEAAGPQVPTGTGTRPATIVDAADMIENARRAGQQAYQAAYRSPVNNRVSLYWLPRMLDAAMNRAAGRSGESAQAIRRAVDQFYITTPGGQRLAMNTLQQLQDARGAVRGQMNEYRRAGRDDLINAVQPFYGAITRLMARMSPQWAQANRQWSDMNFLRMAEELGQAFANRAGPRYREQLAEFRQLAPEAQDIVRIHYLQNLYDRLDSLGDTHSISKLFTNDHVRGQIRDLFGHQALVDFVRAVRNQRIAEASQGMLRNSATHRRGIAQKEMDAETGLVAAVENANARGVRNWLLERATQLLRERRNRPLARVLTTPMSDTAQVAMNLQRMRDQQARLARFAEPRLSRRFSAGVHGGLPAALEDEEEGTR